MAEVDRRDFLKNTVTALGAGSLLGASANILGANDRIRVALIGAGNRGTDLMHLIAAAPGVDMAVVCDPDESRMQKMGSAWEAKTGRRPRSEPDLRRIMDDKEIDAVVIATCDHWHALATIWACQAGKHVYVEKPVCHNLFEGAKMVEAARKYHRCVQGGTGLRSSPQVRKAMQMLHDGTIGDLYMARWVFHFERDSIGFKDPEPLPPGFHWDLWLGPGPEQPFTRNLVHYNWHWFWDFGNGELANNGPHWMDVTRWALNKGLPVKIHSYGGRFGYKDQGQTPNTQITSFLYDDGTLLDCQVVGRYSPEEHGLYFFGTKGYLQLKNSPKHWECLLYRGNNKQPEPDPLATTVSDQAAEYDGHFQNFVDAMRAGKPEILRADIKEIYLSSALCLLGNISYRVGREVRFDPQRERFIGDEEADRLLTRNYRAPFVVPTQV